MEPNSAMPAKSNPDLFQGHEQELSDHEPEPFELPPLVKQSLEAFRRDLPELLKNRKLFQKWVAYHGNERIGFDKLPERLYAECYRRGLKDNEFVVRYIIEEDPEDLDWTPLFPV
jgi:hypothetical protein